MARNDDIDPLPNYCFNLKLHFFKDQVQALLKELETLDQLEEIRSGRDMDLRKQVRQFEVSLIQLALKKTHGHQRSAASLLKIKPTTLSSKIKLYGICSLGETIE